MSPATRVKLLLFCVAGSVGFVVDVLVLLGLHELGVSLYIGRLVSFVCAATTTWLVNRRFTFHRAVALNDLSVRREYAYYMTAMSMGGLVNYAVFALLVSAVALVRDHPSLGVVAGTSAGLGFNFFVSHRLIYRVPDTSGSMMADK
ncbi:MAG: GtrA family protein [Halioglobus sp.]|nr:GtrA family protein [Halioglobus sp.]